MELQFRYLRDISGDIMPGYIEMRDEQGQIWSVPDIHRFWIEKYEPWLAAGNTPLAPEDPWPSE